MVAEVVENERMLVVLKGRVVLVDGELRLADEKMRLGDVGVVVSVAMAPMSAEKKAEVLKGKVKHFGVVGEAVDIVVGVFVVVGNTVVFVVVGNTVVFVVVFVVVGNTVVFVVVFVVVVVVGNAVVFVLNSVIVGNRDSMPFGDVALVTGVSLIGENVATVACCRFDCRKDAKSLKKLYWSLQLSMFVIGSVGICCCCCFCCCCCCCCFWGCCCCCCCHCFCWKNFA